MSMKVKKTSLLKDHVKTFSLLQLDMSLDHNHHFEIAMLTHNKDTHKTEK